MTDMFQSIDHVTLAHVCGGQDNGASRGGDGNVGITVPTDAGNIQIGMQGTYEEKKSAYVACIDKVAAMPGATPQALRDTCGLPPSA